jgi:hypothetical protein
MNAAKAWIALKILAPAWVIERREIFIVILGMLEEQEVKLMRATKENGTHRQASAAPLNLPLQATKINNAEQTAQHRLLEAIMGINMREFMPTGEIRLGKKGNPLWQLAGRVMAIIAGCSQESEFVDELVYTPISSKQDIIFSRWHNVYLECCREKGTKADSEEDLWMMWCDALGHRIQPENGVKLAATLARKEPLPIEALLFDESPKMQWIVATLVMLARITEQGGWITFTYEQLGDAIGISGETAGTYISKLQKMRSPLLCRIKQGKKTVPSEYLLLSPEVLSWANLPDSKKDLIVSEHSKCTTNVRNRVGSKCTT